MPDTTFFGLAVSGRKVGFGEVRLDPASFVEKQRVPHLMGISLIRSKNNFHFI